PAAGAAARRGARGAAPGAPPPAETDPPPRVARRGGRGGHHVRARALEVGGLRRQDPHVDPRGGEPVHHQAGVAHRRGPAGVRDDEDEALHCGLSSKTCRSVSSRTGGAPRRSQRQYSTMPDAPGSARATSPPTPSPRAWAPSAPPAVAARLSSGSRTAPAAPTRSFPPSNGGLTRSTKSASGLAQATSAGSTSPSEMKERSAVTRSGG